MVKQGQITIFAILGVVILIIIFFIMWSYTSNEKFPETSDAANRLERYVGDCSNLIMDDFITKTLNTSGNFDLDENIVFSSRNKYYLGYSFYNSSVNIKSKDEMEDLILNELNQEMGNCLLPLIKNDRETYAENLNIDFLTAKVQVKERVILSDYFFEYSANNNRFNVELSTNHYTNLGLFLNKSQLLINQFTQNYLEDELFNYQFCQEINERRNLKPNYLADFLIYSNTQDLSFLFEEEFYVVFLEEEGEIFSFAIMPEQTSSFC